MEQVLEKTRIQARQKSQEEQDKYSDSDEDWNPEDNDDKTLKERIDAKSGAVSKETTDKFDKKKESENVESDKNEQIHGDIANCNENTLTDDFDELPDLEVEVVTKGRDDKVKENDTEEKNVEGKAVDGSDDVTESEKNESVNKFTINNLGDKNADSDKVTETVEDDLMFDWEKGGGNNEKTVANQDGNELVITGVSNLTESEYDQSDENKENIDPNEGHIPSEDIEKPSASHKQPVTSSNSAGKKRKKIAALTGIDLDSVKPCLSGDLDNFICLEEEEEAPRHPGVQNLMDRLSKHATKVEHRKKKDTDIRYVV